MLSQHDHVGVWATIFLASSIGLGCGPQSSTSVYFDLDGNTGTPETFFDHPFPSDLRLTNDGRPDLKGFPNPKKTALVDNLIAGAGDRQGFSSMTVALFRFDGALTPHSPDQVVRANSTAPFLIIDIDPNSPNRGHLFPVLAETLAADDYLADFGLAVAPWPGTILPGGRTYAAIVMRQANDEQGQPLTTPADLITLAAGQRPSGVLGQRALELFTPMFETLDQLHVSRDNVAAATVFTTADVVADLAATSDAVLTMHDVAITGLTLDSDGNHAESCELVGTVAYPQFQRGSAPFNDNGLIEFDSNGAPIARGSLTAPVRISVPKGRMPEPGFPLMIYFHGSGGTSSELFDLGPIIEPGGRPLVGLGPASVVAPKNIAAASSALPVNPERLAGASPFEYLNFSNLRAMRDTFRQGVYEQRLYLEALQSIEIDPSSLQGCNGVDLNGAQVIRFDPSKIVALGLSMGGMYTNIISAVEPRIRAAVPAGAGGFWNRFVLNTRIFDGAGTLLSILLGSSEQLHFTHPALQMAALAWEATEPMVYMNRLATRPLPGHPVRDIYQPVGRNDRFFDETTFDAAALSLGTRQAGKPLWPSMQASLELDGRQGFDSYPIKANSLSEAGDAFTGVVVQYDGDGLQDPHVIFAQLPEVKHQYSCFFSTFLATGHGTVPAPNAPCPPISEIE